ncbi:hypothetical protein RJ639_021350 [Escallonia herrerae]|uniref:CSC1-like protein n=1 Tax=Escallonia herrerae TaxID=1293975 RepID=A0AA88V5U1_9ASTE|nr:hypothetical protein RJ639_021350 [Escallonia herrerae]
MEKAELLNFDESDAEKMYKMLKSTHMRDYHRSSFITCGLCGGTASSFQILAGEPESAEDRGVCSCLGFFRTRFAANITSKSLLTPNPMQWVTDLAPEPNDVFWSNLCIPYRMLWIRRVATLSSTIVFILFSLGPVGVVCGLANADKLQNLLPFLRRDFAKEVHESTCYGLFTKRDTDLISLHCSTYNDMLFSAVEGSASHSGRKKRACIKVLYFLIWNVFFANIIVGSFIDRLDTIQNVVPREMPTVLARVVPEKAFFFTTYVLTSGWASLACELVQPFVLLCNLLDRLLCRNKGVLSCDVMSFPYHTEIPRLLVFGLIGFTFCTFAPLILPFLLFYFSVANLVYRNQILDVYVTKYRSGGLYWPIVHNVTVFSLVLTHIIALGFFGMKKSTVASGFVVPLTICTLLFHIYCRERFFLMYKDHAAQVFVNLVEWCGVVWGHFNFSLTILLLVLCRFNPEYVRHA